MLYGYLIGIVIMAVMVLSALRPPRRPLSVARVSYFAGVMINQVPLLFLALLTWSTADAVFSGGLLNAAAGWIMFAGGLLVASALVYLQVRATRARPAIFAALASIAPDEPLRPTTSLWLARLLPFPVRPRTIERIPNLQYAPGGRSHRLDLYRRRDLMASAPTLSYLHGGGYSLKASAKGCRRAHRLVRALTRADPGDERQPGPARGGRRGSHRGLNTARASSEQPDQISVGVVEPNATGLNATGCSHE